MLALTFLLALNLSESFVPSNYHVPPIVSSYTSLCMIKNQARKFERDNSAVASLLSRRKIIEGTASLLLTAGSVPQTAQAKEKSPITTETISSAFGDVRFELESPAGGITTLKTYIDSTDFASILEFTKYYDLEFRKAKMVKARKLITSKEDKDQGLYLCNSVTFDLIGMNRASRSGKENIDEVRKYFDELQNDVQKFLDLEKGIDLSAYEG